MRNRILALLITVAMLLVMAPAALAETGAGTAQGYGGEVGVTVTV